MDNQRTIDVFPNSNVSRFLTLLGVILLGLGLYFSLPQLLVDLQVKSGAYATGAGMVAFMFGLPAFGGAIIVLSICQFKGKLKSKLSFWLLLLTLVLLGSFLAFNAYSASQRKKERDRPITFLNPPHNTALPKGECALTARCDEFAYFSCGAISKQEKGYFVKQLNPSDSKSYLLMATCDPKNCQATNSCGQCPPKFWRCKIPNFPED